jgi:hypothetical protein
MKDDRTTAQALQILMARVDVAFGEIPLEKWVYARFTFYFLFLVLFLVAFSQEIDDTIPRAGRPDMHLIHHLY